MTPRKLEELAWMWQRKVIARELLFAFAAACFVEALLLPWKGVSLVLPLLIFGSVFIGRLVSTRPWCFDGAQLARYLNRTYPELEESSVLWLRTPESLTLLERLQRRRVDAAHARWSETDSRSRFGTPPPGFLQLAIVLAGIAILGLLGVSIYKQHAQLLPHLPTAARSETPTQARVNSVTDGKLPQTVSAELTIVPPVYTGKFARQIKGFNAEVEEGSLVTWALMFDAPVRDARLVFGEGKTDVLSLGATGRPSMEAHQSVSDSGLYHLTATLPDGTTWNPSEVYSLKVLKDLPPVINILQPQAPRTEIPPPAPGADAVSTPIAVEVAVTDDYAVASSRIVATVAKGSGEAVKFREQSIAFDEGKPTAGQTMDARQRYFNKTLDLKALGMEPGDELYFYIEATDNRQPSANHTRSETRFVILKGPETKAASPGRGVAGVNLVPQYFRSERQIIIDAEKLIADHPALNDQEFRRRSNDLGIDQQLLRLRYGQFLGEELEQGQGSGDHNEVNLDPLQHGVPADMIHQHDTAPEGSVASNDPRAAARTALRLQLEHKAQAAGQDDEHPATAPSSASGAPLKADQVVAPFVDQHDSQDKATFFDHEAKGTMRDALAAMWDAEGFLRTARPQEALAPANRALTILKDIQQSARAYVQHVGFEPPPLKVEARRLKGDVSDVRERSSLQQSALPDDQAITTLRNALREFPGQASAAHFSTEQMDALRQVERTLTAAATRQPDVYLAPLQTLRSWTAGAKQINDHDAEALKSALLHLLPPAINRPVLQQEPMSGLAVPYFQALEKTEAKP